MKTILSFGVLKADSISCRFGRVSDFGQHLFDGVAFRGIWRQLQVQSELLGSFVVFLRLSQNHSKKMMRPGNPVLGVQSCGLPRVIPGDIDLVQVVVRHCAVKIDIGGNIRTELDEL